MNFGLEKEKQKALGIELWLCVLASVWDYQYQMVPVDLTDLPLGKIPFPSSGLPQISLYVYRATLPPWIRRNYPIRNFYFFFLLIK